MPLSGAIPGGVPGACQYTYKDLQDKYADFAHPRARVLLGDTPFDSVSAGMAVNDIHVEVTSGYEASVASFRLMLKSSLNPKALIPYTMPKFTAFALRRCRGVTSESGTWNT